MVFLVLSSAGGTAPVNSFLTNGSFETEPGAAACLVAAAAVPPKELFAPVNGNVEQQMR